MLRYRLRSYSAKLCLNNKFCLMMKLQQNEILLISFQIHLKQCQHCCRFSIGNNCCRPTTSANSMNKEEWCDRMELLVNKNSHATYWTNIYRAFLDTLHVHTNHQNTVPYRKRIFIGIKSLDFFANDKFAKFKS